MAADKSRLRRGEFELRQRQLPADRRARNAQGSAWKRAREELHKTPLGAPPAPADVRSVYDTRPINAFDFNITKNQPFVAEVGFTAPSPSFVVPEGFVCVLRELDIWANPAGFINRSDLQLSLQLNGGDVPYNEFDEDQQNPGTFNQGIFVGSASGRFPVFLIADEFATVGVRLSAPNGATESPIVYVLFYGQFLLKSGVPFTLQIGNPILSRETPQPKFAPRATPSPPPAPPPAPTQPPTPDSRTATTRPRTFTRESSRGPSLKSHR